MKNKAIWEILIPVCGENGSPFSISHHHKFDEQVRSISGGMTILRSAIGEWGETRERMIPVRFMSEQHEARALASFAKDHYKQKTILVYCISNEIIIIKDKDV